MLLKLIEQSAKGAIYKILPPVQRYFTYFFIIVGIVWLGSANYFYFDDQMNKCYGALTTGILFFVLSGITVMWEQYKRKEIFGKDDTRELIVKSLPTLLYLLSMIKNLIIGKKTIKLLAYGAIVSLVVHFIFNRKNN